MLTDLYREGLAARDAIVDRAELVRQAAYEARDVFVGAVGVGRANRGGRYSAIVDAQVGASILQTPGGIQSEMALIDADMQNFGKELADYVTGQPGYPHDAPRPAIEEFLGSVWSPFYQNWEAWYKANSGWFQNFWWNHAPDAEKFREQLVFLRGKARELGVPIYSAEPSAPDVGPIEKLLGALWGLVRTVVYAGIAIAAVWSGVGIYRQLKGAV